MCRTIFMKIRKCQIIRKLFNNFFFTFMFTCFLLFSLHVSLFFKYLFVCFVLFLSISWCLNFFVVVIYLKNSQLITKVGENRLSLKKNKFQIGIIQSSVFVPGQEWRLCQEILIRLLFSSATIKYTTKGDCKNAVFKNDEEYPTLTRSFCFKPFGPREQRFNFQQPVIFFHEGFAKRQKGHDMELHGDN